MWIQKPSHLEISERRLPKPQPPGAAGSGTSWQNGVKLDFSTYGQYKRQPDTKVMKQNYRKLTGAVLSGLMLITVNVTFGQPIVKETTTTTTTAGTISEFGPKTIIIRSETSPEPIRYGYSKTTQYVDESGQVVAREMIKPGVPVTVHYVREGDRLVADRVIVGRTTTTTTTTEPGRAPTRKEARDLREAAEHPEREARRAAERGKPFPPENPAESKTTITTTTTPSEGIISSFTPEQFVIKSARSESPVTYRYSKTTQYVDDNGAPVSVEIVKSGAPVTVSYIREGDGFIAQRVIVHTVRR